MNYHPTAEEQIKQALVNLALEDMYPSQDVIRKSYLVAQGKMDEEDLRAEIIRKYTNV